MHIIFINIVFTFSLLGMMTIIIFNTSLYYYYYYYYFYSLYYMAERTDAQYLSTSTPKSHTPEGRQRKRKQWNTKMERAAQGNKEEWTNIIEHSVTKIVS